MQGPQNNLDSKENKMIRLIRDLIMYTIFGFILWELGLQLVKFGMWMFQ